MKLIGHSPWWRRLAIGVAAAACLSVPMMAKPAQAQFIGVNVPFVGPVGVYGAGYYPYYYGYPYGYPYYYRTHYWGWGGYRRCHWWHHHCHYY